MSRPRRCGGGHKTYHYRLRLHLYDDNDDLLTSHVYNDDYRKLYCLIHHD